MTHTTNNNPTLPSLRYEDDQYYAGFGRRSMRRAEIRGLGIEWYTSAAGEETVTLYRPQDLETAAKRSVESGGGVLGLSARDLADEAPTVVLPGKAAEDMTVAEARQKLALRVSLAS